MGNALEVKEAMDTLQGKGPEDFTELVYTLASLLLKAGKIADTTEKARALCEEAVKSGKALAKFREFVEAQGGDPTYVDDPSKLPGAKYITDIPSPAAGFVSHIACDEIGICSLLLGGGRETKESTIDLGVGILLKKKVGDAVDKGETLAVMYANDEEKAKAATERFLKAYEIQNESPKKRPLIFQIL